VATTKIHAIMTSPDRCLHYGINDKKGKLRDDIADSIRYSVNDKMDEVKYFTLSSYINCTEDNVIKRFHYYAEQGRGKYRNERPRTKSGKEVVAWHLHQNFEGHEVPPHIANEIGVRLAQEVFGSFACTVSTHTNTENIHNHIVICAWDQEGRKWNNCNTSYRKIRQISDRICEQYGLGVLHKTHEMILLSYKDKNGVQRYYEPTDRKNELIQNKKNGALAGNISEYRNTSSYNQVNENEETNRATIKHDIDNLLPSVRSYDELLDRLRYIGYEINDKKKDGDWLKHITFTAPLQGRGTRDYKLGDGEFYTRERLTEYLENREREQGDKDSTHIRPPFIPERHVKYFETYDYASIDLNDIDNDYRSVKNRDEHGVFTIVQRSDIEKSVINDIRKCDLEVKGLIDTNGIRRIIAEQEQARKKKKPYFIEKREEELIAQIQESFFNLRFMEKHSIYGYEQANDLYKTLYDSYNRNLDQLATLEKLIEHFTEVLQIPKLVTELELRIAANVDNEEYAFEHFEDDNYLLKQFKKNMEAYKINDDEGVTVLREKINEAQEKIEKIKKLLDGYKNDLSGYERCVRVLDRIDSQNKWRNDNTTNKLEALKYLKEDKANINRKGKHDHVV